MDAPHRLRSAAAEREDITITHREYDDETVVVVDFGQGADAEVDIVGDTVIVVVGDDQYELDRPAAATDITTNDGMLLIRTAEE